MKAITLEFRIATEEIGVALLRPCAGGYMLTLLEVDSDYQRRGVGSSLLRLARCFAAKNAGRVVPSPDLSWDGFEFWQKEDPEALVDALTAPDARAFVELEGGDLERFDEQCQRVCSNSSPLRRH
jgi:GNAT superfamily N-acetyltransferase